VIESALVFAPDKEELGTRPIFLTRNGDAVLALSQDCSHLGCPVRWGDHPSLHLSVPRSDLRRPRPAAGAPTRGPLKRYRTRVVDGRVQAALFS
jgi:nitrite reductase/ring-hydroxylating ferredoxin subunit